MQLSLHSAATLIFLDMYKRLSNALPCCSFPPLESIPAAVGNTEQGLSVQQAWVPEWPAVALFQLHTPFPAMLQYADTELQHDSSAQPEKTRYILYIVIIKKKGHSPLLKW